MRHVESLGDWKAKGVKPRLRTLSAVLLQASGGEGLHWGARAQQTANCAEFA